MKHLLIIIMIIGISNCTKNRNGETKMAGSTIENINNSKYMGLKFNIGDEVCIASINQYFKNYKEKDKYPYSLWVTVETKNRNQIGGPTEVEGKLFNILEDSIIYKFAKNTPFCFIGRTQRNGYREIMIYVSDNIKSSEIMDEFINEDKFKRKIEYKIGLDNKWECVSGFIE
jgi:hypothetical protein